MNSESTKFIYEGANKRQIIVKFVDILLTPLHVGFLIYYIKYLKPAV